MLILEAMVVGNTKNSLFLTGNVYDVADAYIITLVSDIMIVSVCQIRAPVSFHIFSFKAISMPDQLPAPAQGIKTASYSIYYRDLQLGLLF
jgi:hypothetical protein